MAKFRKIDLQEQAANFITSRTELGTAKHNDERQGIIHSVRTADEMRQGITRAAQWIKEEMKPNLKNLGQITPEQAQAYLNHRANTVGQKMVDNERRALQLLSYRYEHRWKGHKLERVEATGGQYRYDGRGYTSRQVEAITEKQLAEHNSLSTRIAYAAGLRQYELLTLKRADERAPSKHREWSDKRFIGRDGVRYTVQGKGGLVREVMIPKELAIKLEERRLEQPHVGVDRGVYYRQSYNIGGGRNWAVSFSRVSKTTLGWSTGAHGLRHSYAQERMRELVRQEHIPWKDALSIVSQELGHFREDITYAYLK
ncbi:MAG: site-specific integrase [Mariprofundales bacterium]